MDQLDRCGRKKGNNSTYTRLIHADSNKRLITSENYLNLGLLSCIHGRRCRGTRYSRCLFVAATHMILLYILDPPALLLDLSFFNDLLTLLSSLPNTRHSGRDE